MWAGMTGTVLDFAGTAAPSGWLMCYGQAVSRTTYANLFAAIGTTYGAGDGTTTFNLPDLRGRVAAGKDDMGGTAANRLGTTATGGITAANSKVLGSSGGEAAHAMATTEMPAHTHAPASGGYSFVIAIPNGGTEGMPTTGGYGTMYQSGNMNTITASAGGGSAHNNTQPTFILNKIIKT
jgi:microcystin-dependent protein